jgi:hypothetical protein
VKVIPAVGGTKDWQWEKIVALRPDILVLDREENPKFMAEQDEIPYVDTHIRGLIDLPGGLQKLGARLKAPALSEMAARWQRVLVCEPQPQWDGQSDFPGLIEWGRKPTGSVKRIQYVIWKEPWMGVSKYTFIGSVLEHCGFLGLLPVYDRPYPELELEAEVDESTVLLFSSEPFPFRKIKSSLGDLGYPFALVDGESFSWFGVRSLRFLEGVYGIGPT